MDPFSVMGNAVYNRTVGLLCMLNQPQKPYEFALRVPFFANPKPMLNCWKVFCPEYQDRVIALLLYIVLLE